MRLFIRTEASPVIGLGHFMRCFALAEEARTQGVEVTFLMNEIGADMERRCLAIGAKSQRMSSVIGSLEDVEALIALPLNRDDWVVFDSYGDLENIRLIGRDVAHVLVVDDLAKPVKLGADLIVNPALSADQMGYDAALHGFDQTLLGPQYALIRSEFRQPHISPISDSSVSVMFGGSDARDLTGQCVRRLRTALPDMLIKVVVGPAALNTNRIKSLEALDRVQVFVSPDSVAEVLAGSGLVITAAGGSIGEIATMGLAALVLVVVDNQAAALAACPYPVIDARQGLPDDLAGRVRRLLDDPVQRTRIAAAAHTLVDGKGPARILKAMSMRTQSMRTQFTGTQSNA